MKKRLFNKKGIKYVLICLLLIVVFIIGIIYLKKINYFSNNEDFNNMNNEKMNIQQSNGRDDNIDQVEIITEYINIRSEKDVESNIIGKVYNGDIYSIISVDNSKFRWIEIQTSNNIHGYISGQDEYVKYLYSKTNNQENSNTNKNDNVKEEKSNNSNNVINKNKTESSEEIITINNSNLYDYFEIKKENIIPELNAFGERGTEEDFLYNLLLSMKNSYKQKLISDNISVEFASETYLRSFNYNRKTGIGTVTDEYRELYNNSDKFNCNMKNEISCYIKSCHIAGSKYINNKLIYYAYITEKLEPIRVAGTITLKK